MPTITFGTSGWRAIVADEFTLANIRLAITSIAAYVKTQPEPHRVLVGRDPRLIRRTVGVPPVCIRSTREEAVDALARILGRFGGSGAQAHGWAESSPLADTAEVVAGLFRAWRAAGAEEAIIDQPSPLDDETFDCLAGVVRERLA